MIYTGQQTPGVTAANQRKSGASHSKHFDSISDVVLPGDTEDVGQVKGEVDDPSTGSGQVSTSKRCADEETLHDGDNSVRSQEEEYDARVAVRQQVPLLQNNDGEEIVQHG